jgi:hypothetical protein
LVDVAPLHIDGRAGEFQSLGLRKIGIAEVVIGAFKRRDRLLRRFHPALELRQPPADRLLEDAVGVVSLLQAPLQAVGIGSKPRNLDAPLIRFDELTGGLVARPVEAHFEAAKLDGKLGAELILVGLNIGDRHRHGRLDPAPGQAHGAVPEGRHEHQGKKARGQETEDYIKADIDHSIQRSISAR